MTNFSRCFIFPFFVFAHCCWGIIVGVAVVADVAVVAGVAASCIAAVAVVVTMHHDDACATVCRASASG